MFKTIKVRAYPSMVDEEAIKGVVERQRGVEGVGDGGLGALVHLQDLFIV